MAEGKGAKRPPDDAFALGGAIGGPDPASLRHGDPPVLAQPKTSPVREPSLAHFVESRRGLFTAIALFAALVAFATAQRESLSVFAEPLAGFALFAATLLWLELIAEGLRYDFGDADRGPLALSPTLAVTATAILISGLFFAMVTLVSRGMAIGAFGALAVSTVINWSDAQLRKRGASLWRRLVLGVVIFAVTAGALPFGLQALLLAVARALT